MLCFADITDCLGVSSAEDNAGSLRSPARPHPSLWCGLTAAACLNATKHLNEASYCNEGAATSQKDVLAEARLQPEPDTIRSSSSGHRFDQSERRPGVYMLPIQLLRHMQTLQQDVDADIWQQLWCLYATEDLPPGALQLMLSSSGLLSACL